MLHGYTRRCSSLLGFLSAWWSKSLLQTIYRGASMKSSFYTTSREYGYLGEELPGHDSKRCEHIGCAKEEWKQDAERASPLLAKRFNDLEESRESVARRAKISDQGKARTICLLQLKVSLFMLSNLNISSADENSTWVLETESWLGNLNQVQGAKMAWWPVYKRLHCGPPRYELKCHGPGLVMGNIWTTRIPVQKHESGLSDIILPHMGAATKQQSEYAANYARCSISMTWSWQTSMWNAHRTQQVMSWKLFKPPFKKALRGQFQIVGSRSTGK